MSLEEFEELLSLGEEKLKEADINPPYSFLDQLRFGDTRRIQNLLHYPIPQTIRW